MSETERDQDQGETMPPAEHIEQPDEPMRAHGGPAKRGFRDVIRLKLAEIDGYELETMDILGRLFNALRAQYRSLEKIADVAGKMFSGGEDEQKNEDAH